jgi:hypothetical protein
MKKNIYTITYHSRINYGQFLQAFALQRMVEKSKLVNFCPFFTYNVGTAGRKKLPFFWVLLAFSRWLKANKKSLAENKRLRFTKKIRFVQELSCFERESNAVLIAGSDQIWNESPILKNFYFLNFGNTATKRISYAASLGLKKWSPDFEKLVLPLLKKFDAISVRENSAVAYLTSLGLKNVVCVCDPTILHNGDFYRNEFLYEKTTESFTFVYKIREVIPEYLKELFEKNVRYVDLGKRKNVVSVTDWLANIDNAKFIVTDSFHCAVFCILFHKPFLVLPNRGTMQGMNERFETLLGKTNLKYRVLSSDDTKEIAFQKLNTPIEWKIIDSIIEEWRSYSANWLKNALEM